MGCSVSTSEVVSKRQNFISSSEKVSSTSSKNAPATIDKKQSITTKSANTGHDIQEEQDNYKKIDEHARKVSSTSSKNAPATVDKKQPITTKSANTGHDFQEEQDIYKKIDEHARKVSSTSSKNAPATVDKNQLITTESAKTDDNIQEEQDNYKKIDEHARKVSSTSSKNAPATVDKKQLITTESAKTGDNIQEEQDNYKKIDEHARKAPSSAKNSAEELVSYMSAVSKDPKMLARGFFVWISENIAYDVDGYFGRARKAQYDAESVMKNGRSVCEGYASVFELLCRKADIPVKKIYGFAKGYGYSADRPLVLNTRTDHAWNAIQLEGKWYLIDITWGTGHFDRETDSYKKEFNDFYFLADPKQFVFAHFPYMDNNLEESQKWQLLSKPLTLEEFNKTVQYKSAAFKLGAQAVSHPHGYFEMKNELEMTFRSVGKEEIIFSAILMLEEGNWLKEQVNTTFGYLENGIYRLLIHPPKPGTYWLNVFGKYISDEKLYNIPYLMKYVIKCNKVKETKFEYPKSYAEADRERCILHEPLKGKLPANTEVKFRLSAPHLQHVRVNQDWLEKSGTMFSGEVKTCEAGHEVLISGTRGEKYSTYAGLYTFHTV